MAPFTNSPEDWQRLDWAILLDGGIALYWRPEYLAEDVQWLRAQNCDIHEFDCEQWRSRSEVLSDIARVLGFCDCTSLDALDDDLSDLSIREEGGTTLVFRRFNVFAAGPGSEPLPSGRGSAEVLLDGIARACRFHLLNGKRFLTLVQTEDPDYRIEELGAVSATWNRREWLDAKRRPGSRKATS